MARKVNTVLVGLFIITGIALFVVSVLIFSSSQVFTKKITFYSFFNTSLNGLDIGAPVKFKGVKVGEVSNVKVVYDEELVEANTVVLFNIKPSAFRTLRGNGINVKNYDEFYSDQIVRGLAAKLSMESIITGKLYIDLDYYPNKFINFVSSVEISKYKQMPSVPTNLEEFMANFDNIMKKLSQIEFGKISNKLISLLDITEEKVRRFDLKRINGAMEAIQEVLSEDSSMRLSFEEALREASRALHSVKIFFDFLEKNPNAIVAGKAQ